MIVLSSALKAGEKLVKDDLRRVRDAANRDKVRIDKSIDKLTHQDLKIALQSGVLSFRACKYLRQYDQNFVAFVANKSFG
jgi:hypothetical protein